MEIAIAAIAVIVSLGSSGYYQLKALHRIEEQLGELVKCSKYSRLDLVAEKGNEESDDEEC